MKNLAVLNEHVFHFVTFQEYVLSQQQTFDDWFVYIYYDRDRQDLKELYLNYLQEQKFCNYLMIPYKSSNRKGLKVNKLVTAWKIYQDIKNSSSSGSFDTILCSSYGSTISNFLVSTVKSKYLVYIDEGSSTLRVARHRRNLSAGTTKKSFGSTMKKIVGSFTGRKKVVIFTRYSDIQFAPTDRVINCDYRYTLRKNKAGLNAKSVLFLGNPFPHYHYVNEQNYLALVGRIAKEYSSMGLTMTYKPHRIEGSTILNRIRELGVEVLEDGWPVEIYLMRLQERPHHLASFVTSAFSTVSALFRNEIELIAYEIDRTLVDNNHEFFNSQYAYYRENSRKMNLTLQPSP